MIEPATQTAARDGRDIVLEGRDLVMEFGGFRAVDGASLQVRHGSIHALIGPNGAGKTTCFNLLTKFLVPTSGQILLNGEDITRDSPEAVARKGMVRSFQISSIFPDLTPVENVCVALQSRHGRAFQALVSDRSLRDLEHEARGYLDQVGLVDNHHMRAASLSYGRKRALELATTLALEPKVMLLDEPLAGMSPADVELVSDLIRRVAVGRTVLMVEHNLSVVAALSDRITVLARGRVLAEGDYATVSRVPEVMSAYLGEEDG